MPRKLRAYLADESGATAIEYGLIVALISVASIVAMQLVGNNLNVVLMRIAREMEAARASLPKF